VVNETMSSPKTIPYVFGTLGTFRFILASFVVYSHLHQDYYILGRQAVFLFYIISGYVVCASLYQKYLHIEQGILKFYINRCLRVYPAYWVMLIAAIISLQCLPQLYHVIDGRMYYIPMFESGENIKIWLANITLIATTDSAGQLLKPQFIPPMWSVGVEMVYWLIIPALLLSRPLRLIFLLACVVVTIGFNGLLAMEYNHQDWDSFSYFNVLSAALPFAIGIYMHYAKINAVRNLPHVLALLAAIGYGWFVMNIDWFGWDHRVRAMYAGGGIGGCLIYYLIHIDTGKMPKLLRNLDVLLGNLSYGLLLTHILVGTYISYYFSFNKSNDIRLFYYSYPIACLLALSLFMLVDRPIEMLRKRFRT